MAPKQRFIHPCLWMSERFNELTLRQRFMFIGLFSLADDDGRIKASGKFLRRNIFPDDNLTAEQMDVDVRAISGKKMIRLYNTESDGWIAYVENWGRFQKPKYHVDSILPAPPELGDDSTSINTESGTIDPQLTPNCTPIDPQLSVGMGRDGMGRVGLGRVGGVPPEKRTENQPEKSVEIQKSVQNKGFSPEFELFWIAYPKKIDRQKAFRCWNILLKKGFIPEKIMVSLKNYLSTCERLETAPTYFKNPATFLGPDFTEWEPPGETLSVAPATKRKLGAPLNQAEYDAQFATFKGKESRF